MLTNESSAVNVCGKIIRSNQNHSSPSISVLWSEQLFVCEKQIHHYGVLTPKPLFLARIYNP